MIPLAAVIAVINVLLEILRAWNNLQQEQRDKIVDQWIADDAARRESWKQFTAWIERILGRVRIPSS